MPRAFRTPAFRFLAFAAAAVVPALPAVAQASADPVPEMVTDRPDQSESTNIVPRGYVQMELGATFSRDEDDFFTVEGLEVPGTLARIGLVTDRLELRIAWGGWGDFDLEGTDIEGRPFEVGVDGVLDAQVGLKWRLREGSGKSPAVAVLLSTSVPVGDDELTSDEYDPEIRFAFEQDLGKASLGYNLGAFRDGGETRYLYSAVLGVGLGDSAGAFFELFGDLGDAGDAHSFDTGLTFLARPNVQWDLAAGVGLSEAAPDWFVGVGLTVRLPR